MDLNNLGKNLKFNKRANSFNSTETLTEKEMFTDWVSRLEIAWNRSNVLYEQYHISLLEYEDGYYGIIEDLILIKYGNWKTEIILWYIYGRIDENGEIFPLVIKTDDKEEEIIVKTPSDLWDLIIKIEKTKNK